MTQMCTDTYERGELDEYGGGGGAGGVVIFCNIIYMLIGIILLI
jgi:hypothetical protein